MVTHRSHDYRHLVERWRAVARRAALRLVPFASAAGTNVFCLRTQALREAGGVYLSAGIHGDEPGSTEGLIAWAEKHVDEVASLPLFLLPCLNPWGLRLNLRTDGAGVDLNRAFQRNDVPVIAALRELLRPYRFKLALSLHEDYDAQGFYLYEVKRDMPFWGEALVDKVRPILPIDSRSRIDRYTSRDGVIRRRIDAERFRRIGVPEAVYLHRHHARRAITAETPSEFALEQRIAAHVAVIEECIRQAQSS
jgi:murein peptide amidase A